MNQQINAVLAMCDGHMAELDRIHEAEAAHERRYNACRDEYQAVLIDAVLSGKRIPGTYNTEYQFDPAGIIADEMNEEDHHAMVECVLNFKAGRMSAERVLEILSERIDSALLMAGIAEADYRVGS